MARVCDICKKTAITGLKYSHSHRKTHRRWEANIKKIRVIVNGTPRRLNVCTSCIRSGKVQRAI